jgi:hypothetical protein
MQFAPIAIQVSAEDPRLVAHVLRAAADALEDSHVRRLGDARPVDAPPDPYVGKGGEQILYRLVSSITPKARWLVRQIASDNLENGESCGRTIRHRAGDVNEGTLGGWVWSITSAARRLDVPKPYDTGYEERADGWQVIYRMRSEVAEAVLRALDEEGVLRS